jgi:hypothetical protein
MLTISAQYQDDRQSILIPAFDNFNSSNSAATSIKLPPPLLKMLGPGSEYYFQVITPNLTISCNNVSLAVYACIRQLRHVQNTACSL